MLACVCERTKSFQNLPRWSLFPWASLVAQMVKNLPAMQETRVRSLEKGMATHSSVLAWRIPWTEEPGGLQSMGSQRVRYDWATKQQQEYFVESNVLLIPIISSFTKPIHKGCFLSCLVSNTKVASRGGYKCENICSFYMDWMHLHLDP